MVTLLNVTCAIHYVVQFSPTSPHPHRRLMTDDSVSYLWNLRIKLSHNQWKYHDKQKFPLILLRCVIFQLLRICSSCLRTIVPHHIQALYSFEESDLESRNIHEDIIVPRSQASHSHCEKLWVVEKIPASTALVCIQSRIYNAFTDQFYFRKLTMSPTRTRKCMLRQYAFTSESYRKGRDLRNNFAIYIALGQ